MRCKQNVLTFYIVLNKLLTNAVYAKIKQMCFKSLNWNE